MSDYTTPEYADADQRIYLMNRFHIESFDVRKEDAALLVAASDLLKTAKALTEHLAIRDNEPAIWFADPKYFNALRAAVAKAEGQ